MWFHAFTLNITFKHSQMIYNRTYSNSTNKNDQMAGFCMMWCVCDTLMKHYTKEMLRDAVLCLMLTTKRIKFEQISYK